MAIKKSDYVIIYAVLLTIIISVIAFDVFAIATGQFSFFRSDAVYSKLKFFNKMNETVTPVGLCRWYNDNYNPFTGGLIEVWNGGGTLTLWYDRCTSITTLREWSCTDATHMKETIGICTEGCYSSGYDDYCVM